MIDVGSHLEISMVMRVFEQQCMNVWTYRVVGSLAGTPTATQVGEAWWNHVKAAYRALASTAFLGAFQSVRVREMFNSSGALGEYPIPLAEQAGTRTPPTQGEGMPLFNAAAARLTVATRATRPGQKRFPFLLEQDSSGNQLQAAFAALVNTLLIAAEGEIVLGAPVATMTIQSEIISKSDNPETLIEAQDTTGYVIATNVSSQLSRKLGRGA